MIWLLLWSEIRGKCGGECVGRTRAMTCNYWLQFGGVFLPLSCWEVDVAWLEKAAWTETISVVHQRYRRRALNSDRVKKKKKSRSHLLRWRLKEIILWKNVGYSNLARVWESALRNSHGRCWVCVTCGLVFWATVSFPGDWNLCDDYCRWSHSVFGPDRQTVA